MKSFRNWKQPLLLSILLICLLQSQFAQIAYKDTLYLQKVNDQHLTEYFTYFTSPEDASPVAIGTIYNKGLFKHWKWRKTFNPSNIENKVWFRILARNSTSDTHTFLWSFYSYVDL